MGRVLFVRVHFNVRLYSKKNDLLVSGSIDQKLILHGKSEYDCGYKINAMCFLDNLVCCGGTVDGNGNGVVDLIEI